MCWKLLLTLNFFFFPHIPDAVQVTKIEGLATVIDGDTIEINNKRIRLYGIDAPESSQRCNTNGELWPCGRRSAFALDKIVSGKLIKCLVQDTDRYGRAVCKCYRGTLDINAYMVRQGWAVAYEKYSRDYVFQQEHAKENKLGIWESEFEMPWDYRRRTPQQARTGAPKTPPAQQSKPSSPHSRPATQDKEKTESKPTSKPNPVKGPCNIKGNISSSGEKIYHTPSSPWYSRTKISTSKGERWFCSEDEARRAGWRRAKY